MMFPSKNKTILEFAYRWKQTALRLETLPQEKELILMFIKTLRLIYRRMLVAQVFLILSPL